jgi:C1A family cysteine protease
MNKKLLSVFMCMLMITAMISVTGSLKKIEKYNPVSESITDDNCTLCSEKKESTVNTRSQSFVSYPVMDLVTEFDEYDISPKPEIMYTPNEFSWLTYDNQDWTTPAKRQLCGDCWAFAAIGILESMINIREDCAKLNPVLSEQYILSCLPRAGSCRGGNPTRALQLMMETTPDGNYHNGALLESCFPYQGDDKVPCDDKCSNWAEMLVPLLDYGSWRSDGSSEDIQAIKTQVMSVGPVVAGIRATNFFKWWGSVQHNPNRYFPDIKPVVGINHVVMIVGWKDSPLIPNGGYWICKNSWGTDWGYDGFFNIEYNSLNIDKSLVSWVEYDPESVNWPPIADAGDLYFGDIGEEITFDGSNSFDAEDDIISYFWDFGDGNNGTGVTTTYTYAEQGIFAVNLTVTDGGGNIGTDQTWAGIETEMDPPDTPTISGDTIVTPGQVYEYTFYTMDSNGDDVYYLVDWGEYHSNEELYGPYESAEEVILCYNWSSSGNPVIKAKAIDIYGLESDWGYLNVKVSLNQPSVHQQVSQQLIQRSSNPFLYNVVQKIFNFQ